MSEGVRGGGGSLFSQPSYSHSICFSFRIFNNMSTTESGTEMLEIFLECRSLVNLSWESVLLLKVEGHAGPHPPIGIQPSPPSSEMDQRVHPKAALTPAQLWLVGVSELGVLVWGFEFCVILMIILPQAITRLNGFTFAI